MYNPNMNSNFIAEVGAEWNFCRSYIIRYEVILQVKLSWVTLEITDVNFRRIYEHNRCLPNDANRKSKFKISKMDVNYINKIKFHEESKNELFFLISEVGTEWNFCRSYIIPCEVILQVKLSYFSLLRLS